MKIEHITSACFLPFGDKLILLNQTCDLFEFKWQSKQLNAIFKKVNEDGKGVIKTRIEPSNKEQKYLEV